MRFKLVRGVNGKAYEALVTLTPAERDIVLTYGVPSIYMPGGMGPDRPTDSATVRFGGACYSDVERSLLASLDAFKAALKAEAERRQQIAARRQEEADENEGFYAFPSGQFMDAMRGTKSYPNLNTRCPYRNPARVAAWNRGYDRAHDAMFAA